MRLIDADAIDYAIMFDGGYARLGVYKDEIDKMPTIQPEIETQISLVDCISRQDAINTHCMCSCGKERDEYCQCDDIELWFDVIPSAEPERKKGEWLLNGGRRCECSICHREGNEYGDARFCAYCGAKMKGEENETN